MSERQYEAEGMTEATTVEGWACTKCGRFHTGDQAEHLTRWCCADSFPCDCGGRHSKPWTCCANCREKIDLERYAKVPEIDWDGKTPLCLWRDDTYFWDLDDVWCYLDDSSVSIDEVRFEICRHVSPPIFEMSEFLCDVLPGESDGPDFETVEIDKAVNDFIAKQMPISWEGSGKRPTLESLKRELGEQS